MPKRKKKRLTARKKTKQARTKVLKTARRAKKVVFLVIDGLADLPAEERTPLSEARKPNLNFFAKNGVTGELNLIPKSLWTPSARGSVSHIINISLLGYDPKKFSIKRGPLEAVGANLPYKEGQLALRCNFATVDKEMMITDRRAGRSSLGLDEIARYINENVKIGAEFVLMRTYKHRAVLVIKMALSDKISDSDPYVSGVPPKKVSALSPEALVSAKMVQTFIDETRKVIEYLPANSMRIDKGLLPANYILTRDAGNDIKVLPNFPKKHKLKAVCISENGVMKATCMLAGFDSVTVPENSTENTLDFIFDNIETSLVEYDFVYAHIKGVDEAGHDGNFEAKKKAIEKIDERLEAFKEFKGILVVTCDHITSCSTKQHEYGNVPVLVYGKGKGNVKSFDELSAKKGKLKNYAGRQLLKFILGK